MGTLARCIGHDLEYVQVLARLIGRMLTTGSPYASRGEVPRLEREGHPPLPSPQPETPGVPSPPVMLDDVA